MNNIFYTYIYLDPRKPGNYQYGEYYFDYEPFYVGKGKDSRDKVHINHSRDISLKTYLYNKIRKILDEGLEPHTLRVGDNLSEQEAFDLEVELINLIGRSNIYLGTLTNLTDGGEGMSGHVQTNEQRKNISIVQNKRVADGTHHFITNHPMHDHEIAAKIKKARSKTGKEKMADGTHHFLTNPPMKDPIIAAKTIEAIKEAKSKWWRITYPDGTTKNIKNLAQFCRDNDLNYDYFRFCIDYNGNCKGYKGTRSNNELVNR